MEASNSGLNNNNLDNPAPLPLDQEQVNPEDQKSVDLSENNFPDSSNPATSEPAEGSKAANRAAREVKPQEFKQASEDLSSQAIAAQKELANQHYDAFQCDKARYQSQRIADLCTGDGPVLVFKALSNCDVRGANLSGFMVCLDESDPPRTMRLEDFLLNASKKEIQRVMPHMAWSYGDGKYGPTVFSADKELNDKIRERLKGFSKKFDPSASGCNKKEDLTGLQLVCKEDEWAKVSPQKVIEEATKQAELSDDYQGLSEEERQARVDQIATTLAAAETKWITELEWQAKRKLQEEYENIHDDEDEEAMREYVNDRYQAKIEEGRFVQTPKYVKLMNNTNRPVELTDALKEKVENRVDLLKAPAVKALEQPKYYEVSFESREGAETTQKFEIAVSDSKAKAVEATKALAQIKKALDDMPAYVDEGKSRHRNLAEFLNNMEDGKSYVIAFKGSKIEVSEGNKPKKGCVHMVITKQASEETEFELGSTEGSVTA